MAEKITFEGEPLPFFEETSFVMHVVESWPQASDADIDAVKQYARALNDLIGSATFGDDDNARLKGLAFAVGLLGSSYNGLTKTFQVALEESGLDGLAD